MFRKLDPQGVVEVPVPITIKIDGVDTLVEHGEPVAAILLRLPTYTSRLTPVSGSPRAPYCMMGACFECLVEIDGVTSTRGCVTRAQEGMVVRRQAGRPDPLKDIMRG